MTRATSTRKGCFYTRAQAARLLTNSLGDYDWHKELTCTTERTRDHMGYMKAGILLMPSCLLGLQPHYEKQEIIRYIAAIKVAFPHLKPILIKPKTLIVPKLDKRLTHGRHGFRLNKAWTV